MLSEQDLISKASEIARELRKKDNEGFLQNRSNKIPELHETYEVSVEMKQAIEVHAVAGKKPDKLLIDRAPNQTQREFDYSKNTYQQITLPIFIDFINTYSRAFSDNNWSIDWKDTEKPDSLYEYCEKGIVATSLNMSLENYVFQVVPTLRTIDAMGCLAVRPEYIPIQYDSEGMPVLNNEGVPLVSETELYSPTVIYFPSETVVAYLENKWYLFLTDRKSLVNFGGRQVRDGLIFEYYDESQIYFVEQYGKKQDYTFRIIPYVSYDFKTCPVTRLKGIPYVHEGKLIHQSLFLFAVPNLNEAVIDSVMLRNIKASCVFPYLVMVGDTCHNTQLVNGEVQDCDGRGYFMDLTNNSRIICSVCNGTGNAERLSPLGRMILKPESSIDNGELKATQPALSYVSPSTETPAFLRQEIDNNLEKARNILHLRTSNTQVKATPDLTATGQVLDEKALYSAVKLFSDQNFDIDEFLIRMVSHFRYNNLDQVPVINRSINFDFNTEYEYMERISLAIKNGLPPFAVYEIVYRYLQTMFYNQLETAHAFELITKSDRLLVMNSADIEFKLSQGLVQGWEVILHDSGISILKNLIQADKQFFDKSFIDQQTALIDAAKALEVESQSAKSAQSTTSTAGILKAALNSVNPAA